MNPPTTPARRHQAADDGFALLAVLGTMTVVSILLLSTLAFAVQGTTPSRADQDAKAAVAAAQAGIEEFVSRLNADDTYYANNGVDASNPAFGAGVSVQGTGGAAASYSYRLLTTATETGLTGQIRLRVTGRSRGVTRALTATYRPEGFLKYVYFTDLEAADPALYSSARRVRHNGMLSRRDSVNNGATKFLDHVWNATPAMVESVCSSYYYQARHARTYTTGQYVEVVQPYKSDGTTKNGPATTTVKTADASNKITLDCLEIQFGTGEVVDGPMHSNDALQITGSTTFTKRTTSSWGSNPTTSTWAAPLAAPTDGRLWWNGPTVTLPQRVPETAPVVQLPSSNEELRKKADPATGPGCLYTGHTRIVFTGSSMKVLSPGTTSSESRCYDVGNRDNEQVKAIPPVIYVQSGPCGTRRDIGYPKVDSTDSTKSEHTVNRKTTKYDCSFGTAFVSGQLSGRVTVATSHDIVITGDTTYQGGLTGADALGLIPQGSAWVYNPVTAGGTNILTSAERVKHLDAAILSVGHSFLVQNYDAGSALATDDGTRLRVRGSILQKFRGPVGTSGTTPTGYTKNYIYDARLLNAPPPYFLRPLSSPWRVTKVTA